MDYDISKLMQDVDLLVRHSDRRILSVLARFFEDHYGFNLEENRIIVGEGLIDLLKKICTDGGIYDTIDWRTDEPRNGPVSYSQFVPGEEFFVYKPVQFKPIVWRKPPRTDLFPFGTFNPFLTKPNGHDPGKGPV